MSTSDNKFLLEDPSPEERLSFGKALFDYCLEIFKEETSRQDSLENKSRFYLSFITLIVGACFLNLDFLTNFRDILVQEKPSLLILIIIYVCAIVTSVSLLISLLSIFFSIGIKSYKGVFPKDLAFELFSPTSKYIEKQDLPTLYKTISLNYTVALEHNKNINDKKAKWIHIAALFILAAILSLSFLLGLLGYVMLG